MNRPLAAAEHNRFTQWVMSFLAGLSGYEDRLTGRGLVTLFRTS